jgi:RNA polymerase sigma-70 factor, ECF subfamily
MSAVTSTTPDPARRARFERVFRHAYEPVQRYVQRRAPASVVDDVVADTFLTVWRRLDDVPADAELAWCYAVARRTLANTRRGDQRRDALTARLQHEPVDQPTHGEPALERALAELDPDDRELLRLWAWEGLAPREIAVVLDVSANAASIRLHRAKRALAGKIGSTAGQSSVGPTREEETR